MSECEKNCPIVDHTAMLTSLSTEMNMLKDVFRGLPEALMKMSHDQGRAIEIMQQQGDSIQALAKTQEKMIEEMARKESFPKVYERIEVLEGEVHTLKDKPGEDAKKLVRTVIKSVVGVGAVIVVGLIGLGVIVVYSVVNAPH